MGGKAGTHGTETRGIFDDVCALMRRVAPMATESEKWGTTHFELNGSLFAAGFNRKQVSCYILIPGIFEQFEKLRDFPQSRCCLRIPAGTAVPMVSLEKALRAALATKTSN